MKKAGRFFKLSIKLGLLLTLIIPSTISFSQQDNITLTLALPADAKGIDKSKLVEDFETLNPTIKLIITEIADSSSSSGTQDSFAGLQQLASSGDVLLVSGDQLIPDDTNTGAFLDLTPLIKADATFETNDFFPVAWKSFQWDGGFWALPSYFSLYIPTYNPSAFDNANIPYPAESWTAANFIDAVKTLASRTGGSTKNLPSVYVPSGIATSMLIRSLVGESLTDVSTIPNKPQLDKLSTETLLTIWYALEHQGILVNEMPPENRDQIGIQITRMDRFSGSDTTKRVKSLLPGTSAGAEIHGFVISSGTQHPDQAYILAKYLTNRQEFAEHYSIVGAIAARQSLNAKLGNKLSPDEKTFQDKAINDAIPFADLRYGEYFEKALTIMESTQVDAKTALQSVQSQALQSQQTALAKKGTFTFHIPIPSIRSSPSQSKATLHFGLVSLSSSYNQQLWQRTIDEFLAADPEIGQVDLGFELSNTMDKFTEKYDCFYLPYNALSQPDSLSTLLNLDPLINADPTFVRTDMVSGILMQLSIDNKIWGYPLTIQPEVLSYDSQQFQKANIPLPTAGWSTNSFTDALKALKLDRTTSPVFVKKRLDISQTPLLMLIAAYGSLPLDYRTDPPTVNYTNPETVQNIRQVLDLAKQGYIDYRRTGDFSSPPSSLSSTAPIYTISLDAFSFSSTTGNTSQSSTYKLTTYPQGTQFSAVSYSVGAAYIPAMSQSPEACYRWIRTIAKHPELFTAMPASLNLLNSPALQAQQGIDAVQTYKRIKDILSQSNSVAFPTLTGLTPKSAPLEAWLYQAFDAYILDGSDLEVKLKDAEMLSKAYQGCIANISPYNPQGQLVEDYYKQYNACYLKVQSASH